MHILVRSRVSGAVYRARGVSWTWYSVTSQIFSIVSIEKREFKFHLALFLWPESVHPYRISGTRVIIATYPLTPYPDSVSD